MSTLWKVEFLPTPPFKALFQMDRWHHFIFKDGKDLATLGCDIAQNGVLAAYHDQAKFEKMLNSESHLKFNGWILDKCLVKKRKPKIDNWYSAHWIKQPWI